MSTLNVGSITNLSSINGGQLAGLRNILINGAVTINQRGVTYAAASVGDYWADRWKKTAAGMTQIVEEGNYKPLTSYTLSGTNVVTDTQTSPASGDWDISATFGDVIPSNAVDIQLEEGDTASPFELRPVGVEVMLCKRYYNVASCTLKQSGLSNAQVMSLIEFPVQMAGTPTAVTTHPDYGEYVYTVASDRTAVVSANLTVAYSTSVATVGGTGVTLDGSSQLVVVMSFAGGTTIYGACVTNLILDAELS